MLMSSIAMEPNNAAPPIDENVYEAHVRAEVATVLAQEGEALIRKLLQEEIAAVKKKESDIASVRKKVALCSREVDDCQDALRKVTALRAKGESICAALQTAMQKRESLTARMTAEMEEHRSSVKSRVEANVADIRAKCEARQAEVNLIQSENAELEAKLRDKKEMFEAAFAQFQLDLQHRTSSFHQLLSSCQASAKDLEDVQSKLALVRRERNVITSNTNILTEQLRVYESQFEAFEKTTMTPEHVLQLSRQQKTQADARISQLEKEKFDNNQLRLKADKEVVELRSRLAALKKAVQQAEKTKTVAERKCRQAQERARAVALN